MSALILDAGALIAVDRDDRAMLARLRVAQIDQRELRTTGIVIAEVWHDEGGRQANLARMLPSVDVRAVDAPLGRRAGVLIGRAGGGTAADATLVAIAATGDAIVTGDAHDIKRLVDASGHPTLVLSC